MTRAEYEAKYGTAPATPAVSPTPTATSTPVRMTRAQYESKYGTTPGGSAPAPKKDGFLATLIKDPIETLLAKPADRVAEVVGRTGVFGKDIKKGYELMADQGEGRRIFGMDIDGIEWNLFDAGSFEDAHNYVDELYLILKQ